MLKLYCSGVDIDFYLDMETSHTKSPAGLLMIWMLPSSLASSCPTLFLIKLHPHAQAGILFDCVEVCHLQAFTCTILHALHPAPNLYLAEIFLQFSSQQPCPFPRVFPNNPIKDRQPTMSSSPNVCQITWLHFSLWVYHHLKWNCSCDEYQVMYRSAESPYSTLETKITHCIC